MYYTPPKFYPVNHLPCRPIPEREYVEAYIKAYYLPENQLEDWLPEHKVYRGSYMSAHVLLNLLNELGKEIKCEACTAFYLFFATSLINSIIQEHEC